MTRHSRRRAVALLLSVLLAFVVGEPFRVHECPIHASIAARQGASAAACDAHGSGDAHGSHAAHGMAAAHDAAHDAGAPAAPTHRCDCLGLCGLATLAVLRPHPALWVPAAVAAIDAVPAAERAPALPRAEHVLPFANGPPAVA